MDDNCLDEETLLDFLAGRLDGRATARAREHVARCEICNAIATDVIRDAAQLHASSSSRTTSYELSPGAIVAAKYRLVRALDEGGMGVVWEAESLASPSRPVAIKLLKAFDATARKRFLREIAITAKLSDPGLVRVVDVLEDVEAGCPALVMELLGGVSLATRLSTNALDVRETLQVAIELTRTLAVIHTAGLVHRDLKPANIRLLEDPERPVVLLDLGLAKAISGDAMTRLTRTGQSVGTPAYMAPEQLGGELAIDARADLWSLGVVLYECVTGKRPFAGHTVAEILRSALQGPSLDPEPKLSALLRALLQPDRAARPASAAVVVDMLAKLDRDT